ncbi:hypothetical protein HOC90_04230 [Candidatus Falkowbacteria bacterium]|jgi:hypothetical protein|nr:hypothetical protein [Elusimicrobiaceae bacterium]MBT4433524.1 hypothetical protein [Candidatus Falkowbacteria bacterium]
MPEYQENEYKLERLELRKAIERSKKEKEKSTAKLEKTIEDLAGRVFVRWAFGLMASVLLFPISVIVLDIYWFLTLINGKLYKLGMGWGMALALANFVLLIIIIIALPLLYCIINPVECGLEAAKEVVETVIE